MPTKEETEAEEPQQGKPAKPDVEETAGWRWVRVSDSLLDQLREYDKAVRVKVEDGPEEGEVIITFESEEGA